MFHDWIKVRQFLPGSPLVWALGDKLAEQDRFRKWVARAAAILALPATTFSEGQELLDFKQTLVMGALMNLFSTVMAQQDHLADATAGTLVSWSKVPGFDQALFHVELVKPQDGTDGVLFNLAEYLAPARPPR